MVPINHISKLWILIDGAHKSCRANIGPTRYLKENSWHYVGIYRAYWATGVGPTSNQRLAIKLARWAKWHRANVIYRRRANKTADKMPALGQQMIAIWGITSNQTHIYDCIWICEIRAKLNFMIFRIISIFNVRRGNKKLYANLSSWYMYHTMYLFRTVHWFLCGKPR